MRLDADISSGYIQQHNYMFYVGQDDLAALQGELDHAIEDHQKRIKILETSIEESNNKHKKEVAYFQNLLKEREELDRERESERDCKAQESSEEVRRCLEAELKSIRAELEAVQKQKYGEMTEFQETHQMELTKAQQEVENLREELNQRALQHEEEIRALEEDFEIERDRLLLLHEELTEQLEPARGSGIAKMLELSRRIQNSSAHTDGEEEMELGKLREVLEDLQAQNTMLQDELTLLTNLKGELESELERAREEFQTEREELEFKINELQLNKDSNTRESAITLDDCDQQPTENDGKLEWSKKVIVSSTEQDQNLSKLEEQQKINQDLKAQCELLTKERDSILAEYNHTRGILQGFETELEEKTKDFVSQYSTMKEEEAIAIKGLQDKIQQLSEERDEVLAKVKEVTEEKNDILENLQQLRVKAEAFPIEESKLQAAIEEQMVLASELRLSLEEVTRQKDDIVSQLNEHQNMTEDLKIKVEKLKEERDEMQSKLQIQEEEMQKHLYEKAKEIETLLQDKELNALKLGKEESEKLQSGLKEEMSKLQQTVEQLEAKNSDLAQKLEEASSYLIQMEEEKKLSGSKMVLLKSELEKETSERSELEAKLITLTKEAAKARETITTLEQNQSEMMTNYTGEILELRMRIQELEMERDKLKMGLEEDKEEVRLTVLNELQTHINELEREKTELQHNLEDVMKDVEGLQKDVVDMTAINEKMNEENQMLQAKVSMLSEEKEGHQIEEEYRNQLTEKDTLISQLREEVTALQVSNMLLCISVCLFNSNLSVNNLCNCDSAMLEKEHKQKDEKMNKIKAVAVKAKKELDISKKENKSILKLLRKSPFCPILSNFFDLSIQVFIHPCERQLISYITMFLMFFVFFKQTEMLSSEKEDLSAAMETLRNTVKQLEAQNQDLQKQTSSLERDMVAERTLKEHKMKEAQQSSLLDMEMADYERLVKELNGKLTEGEERVSELKSQINTLTQNEGALRQEIGMSHVLQFSSLLDQGEEKTTKMKQLLVKTKKDLADTKKQVCVTAIHLLCELTAERHRLQEQLRSALEQHQRTNTSLQQRVSSLQSERDNAKLETTASEFESYKVRVHNVLKQQKSKTTSQSDGDSSKTERDQLSSQVELLRSRLCENQQSLQSVTSELQQLQSEHDTLLERHNKILQETISKEAELRERLLSLQSENVSLRSEASQVQADLSSQIEAQRQTYREQLRKLQDEHRATVETLQGQLSRVEEQLFSLQSQTSDRKSVSDSQRKNPDLSHSGLSFLALSDLQSMAREEGEGMETTETESPSPASTPLPSLEQLLSSPDPKQEPFVWTVEPTKEELSQKLSTATRSLEHINSLLHETEATNAVLMEQITLLKSEIRRLERNQEREKSVANLEYLKNVLLQFIFLRSGSERQALLPVIHTMLQLSPEEKSKLAAIAQGEEESSASRGSGWSSYLHSWSGIR
uniref:GRIP domain-containing protein n=1 Tax=Periophthalmus magnuspinnatus TaxID=409849 RepID=A0A3B4AM64_9GOBI